MNLEILEERARRSRESMRRVRARRRGEHVPFLRPGPKTGSIFVVRHGTPSEYGKHGCRCEPCTKAASARAALYRSRKPEVYRAYVKKNQQANVAFIRAQKAKPCADCGIEYPFYVMQFDHVRGKKLFPLSHPKVRTFGRQRIVDEIAKCDVVCANCHCNRTYTRSNHSKDMS